MISSLLQVYFLQLSLEFSISAPLIRLILDLPDYSGAAKANQNMEMFFSFPQGTSIDLPPS